MCWKHPRWPDSNRKTGVSSGASSASRYSTGGDGGLAWLGLDGDHRRGWRSSLGRGGLEGVGGVGTRGIVMGRLRTHGRTQAAGAAKSGWRIRGEPRQVRGRQGRCSEMGRGMCEDTWSKHMQKQTSGLNRSGALAIPTTGRMRLTK